MKKGAPWNVQEERDSDREARGIGKESEREGRKHGERQREGERKGERENESERRR